MSMFRSNRSLPNNRDLQRQRAINQRLEHFDKPLTEKQIRTHMRPSGRRFWVPAALGLALLSYITEAPILTLCALLVFSLGIMPEIWFRIALHGMNAQRSFSAPKVHIGEDVILSYRIENRKLIPVPWLEVEDDMPAEIEFDRVQLFANYVLGRNIFIASLALWSNQRIIRRYHVRGMARGVWQLGALYLRAGDPFGFLQSEVRIEQRDGENALLVLPIVAPLTRFNLPSRHPFGDRRTARMTLEDPSQIVGIRDYAPGDPMRRVHWKATARAGSLQSKVYPPTTVYNLAIFLDINTSRSPADGIEPSLLELGIAAAASVAAWSVGQRYALSLFTNGLPAAGSIVELTSNSAMQATMRVPPSTHPDQLARILELLARIQPYFGGWMDNVMRREEPRLPPGATIIYIAASAAITDPIIQRLWRLQRRGYDVSILLTGETPIATGTLRTYRLGGEEAWHALSEYARTAGGSVSATTARSPFGGDTEPDAGNDEPGTTDGSADQAQHPVAFTLG